MANLKHIIFHILVLTLFVQPLRAQLSKKYDGYQENYYKSMRYGLYKPARYDTKKSYPLIVYLHGSRDTVSRDLAWYQELIQKENPCFVLTPKCEVADQGWGNTWKEQHAEATAKTLALVDSLIKRYKIDPNRLYLYGISMGGFGVFSILQKDPGKFAAAYAVCGGSNANAADKIKGTPLWIFHGEADDVVPVNLSRGIYEETIRQGGTKVRYTEYPGVKHSSWENVSREKTLPKWLFSQERGKSSDFTPSVTKFAAEVKNEAVMLNWSGVPITTNPDKEVWYYKLFRDGKLLTEIDGDAINYTDQKSVRGSHTYSITAVNFFFKESEPQSVKVENPAR